MKALEAIIQNINRHTAIFGESLDTDDPRRGSAKTFTPPTPDELLAAVNLDAAHTPVVPKGTFWPKRCDPTTDGKWIIYDYQRHPNAINQTKDSWGFTTEEIRLYRCRFLVFRDAIFETVITENYKLFPELSNYQTRARVLPAFGIHWVPGTDIKEDLAKQYKEHGYVYADGSIKI